MTRKEYNKAVHEYSNRLFRYALKWTRSEHDANDMVQDVFGKLWVNRKKVKFDKVKSWLFTTMHNGLVNATKKKRPLHLEDVTYHDPIGVHQQFELQDLIEKAMADLSEQHRSIILLRDLEGYNYKEIGDILDLNESQVKVYLFRARQKVKNKLKELNVLVA